MYNKNKFRKLNDKKVLHKIGKRWVVMSVSLLGALGLGGMVSKQVHADPVDSQPTQSSAQNNVQSGHATLVQSQASSVASGSVGYASNSVNSASSSKVISRQAQNLYQNIIMNAQRGISMHQATPYVGGDSSSFVPTWTKDDVNDQVVKGQWGSAPFSFDPNTGMLQTTGKGTIIPIENLGKQYGDQFKLQDIKDIKFAPGTMAPSTSSDTGLFGSVLDTVPTTDGSSDSFSYVSELCNLSDIDCSNLDTSQMTDMQAMFKNDTGLKRIQFGPHFDTSNAVEMSVMFYNDISLQDLDLSGFDTSNVEGITSMFESDYALSDLNLGPNFDTSNVFYMSDVFHSDNSLKNLDLGDKFYVNNGYAKDGNSLSGMFYDDYDLQSLNLGPHFDTSGIRNMSDMFANDSDLQSLDLGKQFDTTNVADMHAMFKGDTHLTTLNLGHNFDTTLASQQTYQGDDKALYGSSDIKYSYNGAQDIFANDNQLNTLTMSDARLTDPVVVVTQYKPDNKKNHSSYAHPFNISRHTLNFPQLPNTAWYQTSDSDAVGNAVDLTDGKQYTGTYGLYNVTPVAKTQLNLFDPSTNESITKATVDGYSGTLIPFAVISNLLPKAYQPVISKDALLSTFPNSPYKYQEGTVNVPVELISGFNNPYDPDKLLENGKPIDWNANGPISDTSHNSMDSYQAFIAKSLAGISSSDVSEDQALYKSYQASVSAANHAKAVSAAQSADQSIANYYKRSVADSVSAANHSKAASAAQSADQLITDYYKRSVADSVSIVNASLARSAAQSADQSIANYYKRSIADSVSVANQSKAASAAQSADQSIVDYYKHSVADSVSVANQSTAASATQSADQLIAVSERSSVANSVSIVNASLACSAAQSADQSIANYYKRSVAASVSVANRSKAESAAQSADQSIAASVASSNAKVQASLSASVSASVSSVNASLAQSEAQSESQSIANSDSASVSASISTSAANQRSADLADQKAEQDNVRHHSELGSSSDQANHLAQSSAKGRVKSSDKASQSDQPGMVTTIHLIYKDPKTGDTDSVPYTGRIGDPIKYSDAIDKYMSHHLNIEEASRNLNDDNNLIKDKDEVIDVADRRDEHHSYVPSANNASDNVSSASSASVAPTKHGSASSVSYQSQSPSISASSSAVTNGQSSSSATGSNHQGTLATIHIIFKDPATGHTDSVPYTGTIGKLIDYTKVLDDYMEKNAGKINTAVVDQNDDHNLIKGKDEIVNVYESNDNQPIDFNGSEAESSGASAGSASSVSVNSQSAATTPDYQSIVNSMASEQNSIMASKAQAQASRSNAIAQRLAQESANSEAASYDSAENQMVQNSLRSASVNSSSSVIEQRISLNSNEVQSSGAPQSSLNDLTIMRHKDSASVNKGNKTKASEVPTIVEIPVKHRYLSVIKTCLAHYNMSSIGQIRDYYKVLRRGTRVHIVRAFKVRGRYHTYYRYEIVLHHHHYFITGNFHFMTYQHRHHHYRHHRHSVKR